MPLALPAAHPASPLPAPPAADANYRGLSRLYDRYKDFGLMVLAFPCNQFDQEPGTHAEIEAFVSSRFSAQFPLMSKVEVNGASQHPIFAWLKAHTPPMPGAPARRGRACRWPHGAAASRCS